LSLFVAIIRSYKNNIIQEIQEMGSPREQLKIEGLKCIAVYEFMRSMGVDVIDPSGFRVILEDKMFDIVDIDIVFDASSKLIKSAYEVYGVV